jgi:hypothetical protein
MHGVVEQLDSTGIQAAISRARPAGNVQFEGMAAAYLCQARCCLRLRGRMVSTGLGLGV